MRSNNSVPNTNCSSMSVASSLAMVALVICGAVNVLGQSPLTSTQPNGTPSRGNMFDVKSLIGITINDFDVAFTPVSVGAPTTVQVWMSNTAGSYLGTQTSSSNWTLLVSLPSIAANGTPTNLGLNLNVMIPAGQTQAFYITTTPGSGLKLRETVGTAGGIAASNSDLELYTGHGGNYFNLANPQREFNGSIHYSPAFTVAEDLQLARIIAPANDAVDCAPKTSTETVTIEMRNIGMNVISAGTIITAAFQVDNGLIVSEPIVLAAPMATGGTRQHTFVATADLSALGNHTLAASVAYNLDVNLANNTLPEVIGSGGQLLVTSLPFTEDFALSGSNGTNLLPLGFINETTDSSGSGSDWLTRDDATSTTGSGPAADHTTGISGMGGFVYVEDDRAQPVINMRSPCFDLSGLINPNLRFFMHSNNASSSTNANKFSIDVISQPSGVISMDVFGPQGETGLGWIEQAVDLGPFVGQTIQLVFRGETLGSLSNLHDIALDDISVVDLLLTPGQAPQPGLAVLDINDCRNPNLDPIRFAFGGPYFTSISAGDTLNFRIEGPPSSSILLLTGPLNPASAGYSNIGQLDIGSSVNPQTGIPTQITVVADGSVPGGLNLFFNTAASGITNIGFSVPNLPLGVLGNFQCVVVESSMLTVSLSNAVQITVQ